MTIGDRLKLSRVASHRFVQEGSRIAAVVVDGAGLVCLVLSTADWRYRLVVVDEKGAHGFELNALAPHEHGSQPALMAAQEGGIVIVANRDQVLWYPIVGGPAKMIPIKNRRLLRDVVPPDARVMSLAASVSDSSRYPVTFEQGTVRRGQPRHWAVLELDLVRSRASWQSWGNLTPHQLEHYEYTEPPKIEAMMSRGDRLLVSTTGGKTTSVNKWGMDYYALTETTPHGDLTSLLWGGSPGADDGKKHGVNLLLTSSYEYAILTPLFGNGEWKGEQKLLDLATRELHDITLPRGAGARARVIQHASETFWIWTADHDDDNRNWTITLARAAQTS